MRKALLKEKQILCFKLIEISWKKFLQESHLWGNLSECFTLKMLCRFLLIGNCSLEFPNILKLRLSHQSSHLRKFRTKPWRGQALLQPKRQSLAFGRNLGRTIVKARWWLRLKAFKSISMVRAIILQKELSFRMLMSIPCPRPITLDLHHRQSPHLLPTVLVLLLIPQVYVFFPRDWLNGLSN